MFLLRKHVRLTCVFNKLMMVVVVVVMGGGDGGGGGGDGGGDGDGDDYVEKSFNILSV